MKYSLIFFIFSLAFNLNAQNLSFDTSFGNNGKSVLSIITSTEIPVKVFYENNKYIFIYSSNGLCSVNYNGTLDNSFGINGSLHLNSDNVNDTYLIKGAKLIAGYIYIFGRKSNVSNPNKDGFIAKISTTGSYDLSFGTNGKAIFNLGENEEIINDIILNSSSQIYAIGTKGSKIFLSKINAGGNFDLTFNTIGYKVFSLSEFESSVATNLYFQGNEILLVGSSNLQANISGSPKYLILLKVNENGVPVNSFGENGLKTVILNENSTCTYVVRNSYLKNNNELFFETLEACSFLSQFNKLFKYNFTENSLINLSALPYENVSFEIDLTSKIFFTGSQRCNNATCNRKYYIYKINSDGSPDLDFNTTGNFFYQFGPISDDKSSVFFRHNDGKILVAGHTSDSSSGNGLGIIRLTSTALSLDEKSENSQFTIFPNPTKNQIFIDNILNREIDSIDVKDINGRKVNFINIENRIINIENLQTGIYFLMLTADGKESIYKFIKN